MSAVLTAQVGIKLGPIIIGTLIQHFLRRDVATKDSKAREELLYDEAFTIVKKFMDEATRHTIEEIQAFSNTRIPSPPWVRTVRVMVPLNCCDKAADNLIKAFGGVEAAKDVAGGVRWWQVRGLEGVPSEWIMVRKDIDARRKQRKAELRRSKSARMAATQKGEENHATVEDDKKPEPHIYSTEMDGTPCMLYIHGGGGYFGSLDQERYMMHRYARKISGRVFAVNYRLAPQYPFPCALQDVLAAFLYLIEPPPGAHHVPVDPALIIIAGDSAGGNLALALLQVIRDAGLPRPAGGVPISPWCDLTHSFASCYENMSSDIIPPYGLALHKPSTLWPPPAAADTAVIRERLSSRLQKAIRHGFSPSVVDDHDDTETLTVVDHDGHKRPAILVQKTTPFGDKITVDKVPLPVQPAGPSSSPVIPTTCLAKPGKNGSNSLPIEVGITARAGDGAMVLVDGKAVTIRSQIQFYATNRQINHPYVSPVLGYLGGLPPCLFIVSDKECLRDEIIYTAHKAARPTSYPVKPETREFHPLLAGIEERYGPTDLHLQIYDETCHVLPLYSFTTPAKYCYRAIATFCKYVTKSAQTSRYASVSSESSLNPSSPIQPMSPPIGMASPASQDSAPINSRRRLSRIASTKGGQSPSKHKGPRESLLRRLSLSALEHKTPLALASPMAPETAGSDAVVSSPVSEEPDNGLRSPIHGGHEVKDNLPNEPGTAGNPDAYACEEGCLPFVDHMMRERISTRGVIRPLEPEGEIPACTIPLDQVAVLNERSVRRYIEGQTKWDRKFASATKSIEKSRRKNLKLARKEGTKTMDYLRNQLHLNKDDGLLKPPAPNAEAESSMSTAPTSARTSIAGRDSVDEEDNVRASEIYAKTVLGSRHWTWGWVLEGENPPPASIVSRRDTEEARHLSRYADRQLGPGDVEHQISGNHLWSMVVEALAAHSRKEDKSKKSAESSRQPPESPNQVTHTHTGGAELDHPSGDASGTAGHHHRRSLSRFFTIHRRSRSKARPDPAEQKAS